MPDIERQPWQWRKAAGGWTLPSDPPDDRLFHAYDVNDHAACSEHTGLVVTAEEPNEGSRLCEDCVRFVATHPAGRDRKDYPSE